MRGLSEVGSIFFIFREESDLLFAGSLDSFFDEFSEIF